MNMLITTPLTDRALHVLTGTIMIACLIIAMWAVDYEKSYPLFYSLPRSKGMNTTPFVLMGIPLLLLGIPVALSMCRPAKVYLSLILFIFLLLAASSLYSIANVTFSRDEPMTINATVVEKREIMSGKNRSYILQIATQPNSNNYEFSSSYRFYENISVGERLTVKVHSGFFGKRWVREYRKILDV